MLHFYLFLGASAPHAGLQKQWNVGRSARGLVGCYPTHSPEKRRMDGARSLCRTYSPVHRRTKLAMRVALLRMTANPLVVIVLPVIRTLFIPRSETPDLGHPRFIDGYLWLCWPSFWRRPSFLGPWRELAERRERLNSATRGGAERRRPWR